MTGGHRGRASLGLLSAVSAGGCLALVVLLSAGEMAAETREGMALLAWASGLLALVLAVLAVQEHHDPDDDPRYLATIVQGLRAEWRRGRAIR